MRSSYRPILLLLSTATFGFAFDCAARPVSIFYPFPDVGTARIEAKTSANNIEIISSTPRDSVILLGELRVDGDPGASLYNLMAVALSDGASRGADFVALSNVDAQHNLVLGKMVPMGHGRSIFVAGPVKGSEVNRIAVLPSVRPSSLRVVLGKYLK